MWQIHDYKETDFQSMLDLGKEVYGEIEITEEDFIRWQYFTNPTNPPIIRLAKNEENELVSQLVMLTVEVKVIDKDVKAGLAVNLYTKKEYRKQGIFLALCEELNEACRESGYAFTYCYPNKNSYTGFSKSYTVLHMVPLLLYPLDLKNLVAKKLNKTLAVFAPNWLFRKNKKSAAPEIIEAKNEDLPLFEAFWETIKEKYPILLKRNVQFIKWRYMDAPNEKYKVFVYKKENTILGYIVAAIRDVEGIINGMIVDFLINSDDAPVGEELINKCFEHFRNNDAELVGCLMLEHTQEYKILKKCGLIRCPKFLEPQPFPLSMRILREEQNNEDLKNINNWYATMGDFDAV